MEERILPPWTKKKRMVVAVVMTGLILSAALLLGTGVYRAGVSLGWIKRPFSKRELINNLLNDAGFVRAVNKSVSARACQNETLGFGYAYQAPFRLITASGPSSCTQLVTLHQTGADVLVKVEKVNTSREILVASETKTFSQIETSLLEGAKLPTSQLAGLRQGVETQVYVIGLSRTLAFKLTYAPVSQPLTPKVIDLVRSFYSTPQ